MNKIRKYREINIPNNDQQKYIKKSKIYDK